MKPSSPCVLWSLPTLCAESDCACVNSSGDPFTYRSSADTVARRRPPDLYLAPLPVAHTLAFNPRRPEVVAALNAPARRLLDGFSQPAALTRASDILREGAPAEAIQVTVQLAALELLEPYSDLEFAKSVPAGDSASNQQQQPAIGNPQSILTTWLHLTDACNLACTYCYVAKSAGRMDETTGRGAVEAVFRLAVRHSYRAIKLKYAGGEPTLNFKLVRALHAHAVKLAGYHGLELHEVLLSNGTALTPAMLDFLKTAGIRLMISLDGLSAAHDRQRPMANGGESSGLVLAGLDRALAHGLMPHVSVTVSPASAAGLAETTSYLLDRDLPFNWNFVRDSLSPERDWPERLIADLLAAVAVIETRLPRRRLIDGLLDRSSFAGAHAYPCGAGRDYLAISHRGEVANCHMTLGQPVGDIWTDDPLAVVRAAGTEPRAVSVEEREGCKACLWRHVCGGGCPLLAHRTTGHNDTPSFYCNVYRAVLPELLRLEGLRILKWQATTPA